MTGKGFNFCLSFETVIISRLKPPSFLEKEFSGDVESFWVWKNLKLLSLTYSSRA